MTAGGSEIQSSSAQASHRVPVGVSRAESLEQREQRGMGSRPQCAEHVSKFLVDLALNYRDAFVHSGFFNLPAFPGAIPDLATLVSKDDKAKPPDKYALLRDATSWSTNIGHPGHANAATEEVFNKFIVPKMFAAAARGGVGPAEAVAAAEAQMKPIFEKWRDQGKI